MYATTTNQLIEFIKKNPKEMPSTFLMDSSFASYCYDKRTIKWLKSAFNRDADPIDCEKWDISRSEWKENIAMALVAKKASIARIELAQK